MAKELLSIRDENTILITVRFVVDYGSTQPTTQYDFDLIVKNDITVDKLLNAIFRGLCQAANVDDNEMDKISKMFFVSADIHYNFSQDIERLFQVIQQIRQKDRDSEKEIYRKCLGIFLQCLHTYVEDNFYEYFGPLMDTTGEKREAFYRIPHITVDCMDSNKWESNFLKKEDCTEKETAVQESLQIEQPLPDVDQEDLKKEEVPYTDIDQIISLSDAKMFQLGKSKVAGKTLKEIGFVTSTRLVFTEHDAGVQADKKDVNVFLFQNQKISKQHGEITENRIVGVREGYRENIPLYNISNRPLYLLNTESVKIIPPTERPKEQQQGVLKSMISPVLMSIIMIASRSGMASSSGISKMNILYALMGVIAIATTVYGYIDNKRTFEKSENDWKTHYERYIQRILYDIVEKQECDKKQLKALYPSMLGLEEKQKLSIWDTKKKNSLVDMCAEIHPDIFTRGKEHPDFLTIRIGLSTEESCLVSSVFSIVGEKKDYIFTSEKYTNLGIDERYPFTILLDDKGEAIIDDIKTEKQRKEADEKKGRGYLIDLPAAIAKKYAYLKDAPVLLKLRECEILGIVLPKMLFWIK